MKKSVSYIFNCNGIPIGLVWGFFNSVYNKYGNLLRFVPNRQDSDYIIGFSTNETTLASLRFETWKSIVDEIKNVLLKHNIETYGLKNTSRHIRMSPPWEVDDTNPPKRGTSQKMKPSYSG